MNYNESINKTRTWFENSFNEGDFYNLQTQDDFHLDKIIQSLDIKDECRILDLGTGSGYVAFTIANNMPESKVIGLDIVNETIDRNNLKAKEESLDNVNFISYSGMDFPFENNAFDVVVTRYALHHFPDISMTFGEISRVLKKGGQLFISDPTPNKDDDVGFVDKYMQVKPDGHIKFYREDEYIELSRKKGIQFENSFTSEIRFPRKHPERYMKVIEDHEDELVESYQVKVIGDEVYITEQVLNISFRKV